eukprot:7668164-Alexandrium_andersonii.AAC.1
MSASLVGSEMCIRDRRTTAQNAPLGSFGNQFQCLAWGLGEPHRGTPPSLCEGSFAPIRALSAEGDPRLRPRKV